MKRHRILALTALLACSGAMAAGCTFLIDFDAVPDAADGSTVDGPGQIGQPDVRVDAFTQPDAPSDAGLDAHDAIANPDACKGNLDGKYCGGDQIVWPPPGSKDDLVTCKTGAVSGVRTCTSGVGCIRMLSGYPDQCDECATKADGTYCGRDMAGWDPSNANTRVRCQNKAEVGLLLCANGCSSNGAASICK